jgi:hypothetical protein
MVLGFVVSEAFVVVIVTVVTGNSGWQHLQEEDDSCLVASVSYPYPK